MADVILKSNFVLQVTLIKQDDGIELKSGIVITANSHQL